MERKGGLAIEAGCLVTGCEGARNRVLLVNQRAEMEAADASGRGDQPDSVGEHWVPSLWRQG